ncbi:hypothetical protein [Chromobacterium vaccinii]|nr:hypothetical protein [Chromobacterium vaccinii]
MMIASVSTPALKHLRLLRPHRRKTPHLRRKRKLKSRRSLPSPWRRTR